MGTARAWFEMWATEAFLAAAEPVLPSTLVPVLQALRGDPEGVERAYREVRAQRGRVSLLEGPRARARRRMCDLVRELEWVCAELRQVARPVEYEALLAELSGAELNSRLGEWPGRVAALLRGEGVHPGAAGLRWLERRGAGMPALLRTLRPLSFLLGEVVVDAWRPEQGKAALYVPLCKLRAAVPGRADEVCLRLCKAGVERASGPGTPLRLKLRPARNGSCEVRVQWDARRPRAAGDASAIREERVGRDSVPVWN